MIATERKTSRIKRICVFSNFVLIFQLALANLLSSLPRVEFLVNAQKFLGRGRIFYVFHETPLITKSLRKQSSMTAKKFTKKAKSVMHMYSCCFAQSHCFFDFLVVAKAPNCLVS